MKGILFYTAYVFLWLFNLLPLRILYLFSDFLYLLAFHLIRYRRKTAQSNLERSFPDKSPGEIRRIMKKSSRQLTDYFTEWMYQIHMGEKELARRLDYANPEVLQEYFEQGKSVMLLMSHYGNWEWTSGLALITGHVILAVYKPLQNRYFDKLFLDLRGKFGVLGVPMESTLRRIIEYTQAGTPVLVMSLADQRPQWKYTRHWTRFLNQDTAVIAGSETIARKFGMPVVLLTIDKVRRGYYRAEFQTICEDPMQAEEFEITRRYLGILQNTIQSRPELWLWTHKRWKYERKGTNKPVDIGPIIT